MKITRLSSAGLMLESPSTTRYIDPFGVVGTVPHVNPPSEMFGTMTPMQAVTATRILGAATLIPMHYAQFGNPPLYNQFADIEDAPDEAGDHQKIEIRRMKERELIEI